MNKLSLMRQAARVERFHTMPMLRVQTVGEHTFNVMALIDHLYADASLALYKAALYHDVPEALVGDIPSTAKWRYPKLKETLLFVENEIAKDYELTVDLTQNDDRRLRFCDLAELMFYSLEEAARGNSDGLTIAGRCMKKLYENNSLEHEESELLDYLKSRYYSLREF